jgi:predicted acyl esterase
VRRIAIVFITAVLVVLGVAACTPEYQVDARGGTGQIIVNTAANATVALYDQNGRLVPTTTLGENGETRTERLRETDDKGYVVLRYVAPGSGYVVRRIDSTATKPSKPVTVTARDFKPASTLYTGQTLNNGYGYMKMRDGTLLSYMVRLPGPIDKGPYPTLIEYSGYDPANPFEFGSTTASTRIASLLGYATVGVNIRGTGCSGGAFQLWEDAQAADGYDVVETVAAQPWVKNHKVGLVGLSYPGNGALYAASTQPPSLAAVAVGGTYDDGFRNLLRPSGMVNTGFARGWIEGRYAEAEPGGQAWTRRRIAEGDAVCSFNQEIRAQNLDLSELIDSRPYFPEEFGLGDSFAPQTFVNKIKAPTLVIATWHDEQVGGHMPTMIPDFTGTTKERFILTNGGHAEMFAMPDAISRWGEFLDLYVKRQVPEQSTLKLIAPIVAQTVIGSSSPLTQLPFPANRFTGKTYTQALASYEAEPRVRVLFENGAGVTPGVAAGLPQQAFAQDFATYPIPGTTAQRWFFGPGGTLTPTAPTAADDAAGTIDSYVSDPAARPKGSKVSGGDWAQFPTYNWAPPVPGKGLSYLSPALTADTTMIGSGSVDLWLRSNAPDTDLQVTLAEVRPDGKEYLVQSGWMRASVRKIDTTRSTTLQPLVTMKEADAAPLPAGQFSPVRVEIYPFAHVFRAGSKVRLIITAPGGDRIAWTFDTLPGTQANEVARSVGRPSSVALPVVSGVTVPTGLPLCPGLRGQPCRTYTPPAS